MKTLTLRCHCDNIASHLAGMEEILFHPQVGNDIPRPLLADLELEVELLSLELEVLKTEIKEATCSSK